MSFIHKFIDDNETPEPVKYLFKHFVSEFEKQDSIAWNKKVKQTSNEYHRKNLLKQGRCDFDNPPFNLTSEELIILYNYYYFPMHFQSSYEIYNELFTEQEEFTNQIFFFHDFGCGTLSSAMAFGASFQKYNLSELLNYEFNQIDVLNYFHFYFKEQTYDSVHSLELGNIRNAGNIINFKIPNLINGYWLNDISISIINYLKNVLLENFNTEPYQHHFFNSAGCTDGHFYFGNVADKFYLGKFDNEPLVPFKSFCNSQNKAANEITVILNFSYVLASESIDIEGIKILIEEYQNTGCNLIVVNQNPNLDSLNTKWELLKRDIEYDEVIKGVQSIKHFGSKSKVRFEVIKCNEDVHEFELAYHIFTKFNNLSEIDTEGDYLDCLKNIKEFDVFNYRKTLIINKENAFSFIKLPMTNEWIRHNLETWLESNFLIDIENKTILNLVSNGYFVDTLCNLIEHNVHHGQGFLFPYFTSTKEIHPILTAWNCYYELPYAMLVIWKSICKNLELFNLLVKQGIVELVLTKQDKFSLEFIKLITENNLLIFLNKAEMKVIIERQADNKILKFLKEVDSDIEKNDLPF